MCTFFVANFLITDCMKIIILVFNIGIEKVQGIEPIIICSNCQRSNYGQPGLTIG